MKATRWRNLIVIALILTLVFAGFMIVFWRSTAQLDPNLAARIVGAPELEKQRELLMSAKVAIDRLRHAAPPLEGISLGPGISAYPFTSGYGIESGYETIDGLYTILLFSKGFTGDDHFALARLEQGRAFLIPIPHTYPEQAAIVFNAASTNDHAVVSVFSYKYGPAQYVVRHNSFYTIKAPTPEIGNLSPPSGCIDLRSLDSPYAFAASTGGSSVPLITKTQLQRATSGVSQMPEVSVQCFRFAGSYFLRMDAIDGVTYRISGGTLIPVLAAAPQFRTTHYMLFELGSREIAPQQGSVGYHLEVEDTRGLGGGLERSPLRTGPLRPL